VADRGASVIKSQPQIEAMARAGAVAREALRAAAELAHPGVTTASLDLAAAAVLTRRGALALFPGYTQASGPPYPTATCVCVNDEVVHAIPGPRVLEPSDLVTIDIGVRMGGWCADSALSLVVPAREGQPFTTEQRERSREANRLLAATRELLAFAVRLMTPGRKWSEVAKAMEGAARGAGFGIVTEYIGHGIGRELHESPRAPAYWTGFRGEDFRLETGMTLAIEPMLTSSRASLLQSPVSVDPDGLPAWRTPVRAADDHWTALTIDGSLACHEEHVVAVTQFGPRILTADAPSS